MAKSNRIEGVRSQLSRDEPAKTEETIPQLVDEYHKVRLQVVLSSALLLLLKIGGLAINDPFTIPVLNIEVKANSNVPHILAALLLYSLIRLCIEWSQSHPVRRKRRASRLDLIITTLLAVAALSFYSAQFWNRRTIKTTDLLWMVGLLSVGIVSGRFISNSILTFLFFVRSKEEALLLGLPRIPVALRTKFKRSIAFELIVIIFVIYKSRSFTEPLASIWLWLLFLPLIIISGASIWSFITGSSASDKSKYKSLGERLVFLRAAYTRHDAAYQIYGWDKRARHKHSPFFKAAEQGDIVRVHALIQAGANPDAHEHIGWTPLLSAAANGHEETVRLLLEMGANVNSKNLAGRTALMFASRYGFERIVQTLIDYGADVNCCDELRCPNALAIATIEGHIGIVRLLLKSGAESNIIDVEGKTALDWAHQSGHGEIATLLRKANLRHSE